MKSQLKSLIIQIIPSVDAIPYILFALIPIIFIYFLISSRKFVVSMVAMTIVMQHMTPISYYQFAGVKGLQPVYLWWIATFAAVIFSRNLSRQRFEFRRYFALPLLFFFIIQAMAWSQTFLSSQHPFYMAGLDRSLLFLGYFLNPLQILLTGWMIMLVTEEKEGMIVIQKSLMISAIIFGGLITVIYLKTGSLSGSSEKLFEGRFSINNIMGEENNGIAAISVFLFIACVTMKAHGSRMLNIISIGAILSGILFTLSRMAWINAAFITILLLPRVRWLSRIVIVLFIGGLYLYSHTMIVNRLYYGIEKEHSSTEARIDNISANRITIWAAVWDKIQESPVFGSGIQTPVKLIGGEWVNHPHNAYLRTLLDMGIIGLLAVFIAYGYLIRVSFNKSGLLLFSIISLFVMGFVCLEYHPHKQNYLIWIFYAMTLNEKRNERHPRGRTADSPSIQEAHLHGMLQSPRGV
jgi:O-antigen ligase